ncbi:carbohydrate kinase family protein [Candidatus Saccharibacteria bacterium]|nr:carbohydrate kinase family protein [Candidatus Saccharibacteria bacterium]
MARICSLGSSLQDIYLVDHDDLVSSDSVYDRITVGTKVDIDKISYEVGGGATNAAVTFVRHGHESVILSNVGRDIAAEAIRACLDDEGIDSSYIETVRENTGCSVILLDSKSGERTILTHRGASARFDNLSEKCLDNISPDWLYVTSLRGDMTTLKRFFKYAKKNDIRVMFNPGKLELEHKSDLTKLLEYVDVLLVNKREAAQIVPGETLEELLSRLKNYLRTVIITDGQMGAIARDGSKTYRFGLYEDLKVKDTTGAGDAFGSGFLAHFAAGYSFKDSLVFASANSTSVVSKLGAKTGILTGREKLHQMVMQEIK